MPFFVEPRKLVRMFAIKLGISLAFLHDIGEIRNIYSTFTAKFSKKQHFHYDTQNATLRCNDFIEREFETSVDFKSLLLIDCQGFTVTYQNLTL